MLTFLSQTKIMNFGNRMLRWTPATIHQSGISIKWILTFMLELMKALTNRPTAPKPTRMDSAYKMLPYQILTLSTNLIQSSTATHLPRVRSTTSVPDWSLNSREYGPQVLLQSSNRLAEISTLQVRLMNSSVSPIQTCTILWIRQVHLHIPLSNWACFLLSVTDRVSDMSRVSVNSIFNFDFFDLIFFIHIILASLKFIFCISICKLPLTLFFSRS